MRLSLAWRLACGLACALGWASCRADPAADRSPETAAGRAVTFSKDIAPILYANCVPCHRPGQVAPFSLITHADAKRRAGTIADVTEARRMPPWLPEAGDRPFAGERRLRADEIALIRRWADAGAPEGDAADLPRLPAWPDGWEFGQPDLVVTMARPYTLSPGSHDHYRQLVYPLSLPAGRFVRAVEFRAGAAPVHHAVVRVDRTHASRRRDGVDGQPGFEGVMAPDVRNPDGHFVGWSPGRGPIVSPPKMPWRLERGTDLVVEVHLIPGAAPIAVQPSIGLFFTDTPPVDSPVELTMGVKTLDIPAGERAYRVTDRYEFPVEVSLLSLYPHAHYLGKAMDVTATLPDGTVTRLLRIPRWDFHWQRDYQFVTPVILPRGATLSFEYTYDNSADNDDNPSNPPRRVLYGLRSMDEMANLAIQVLPRSKADGRQLVKAFLERDARANVASAEMRVRIDPSNFTHQWELGRSYVEAGRTADALRPLEAAIRIDPAFAKAYDYLGRAQFAERRPAEALAHLQRAVTLDPRDEVLHLDLGKVLVDLGRGREALQSFERALAINPEYGQGHEGAGIALVRLGRFTDAVAAFRRAVALLPESASAANGLAVALAQAGQKQEALEQVRRALDLDPDYVPARDNLARLLRGGR